jgi:N-methylhydantoinase A
MLGIPDLVAFDMGGTSTDISLISEGHVSLSADGGLDGERIALRSLDIASLAAGGGSIASVDRGGVFRVGPQSAGAMPGPAAYGSGGVAATVTDANVVLGYLGAKAFMGGRRLLDVTAAEAAIDRLADALKIDRIQAAAGVFRLVNLRMADGIRLMTVRRGVDPRRYALLSFGGAAGLHAVELARELDIARIIVPTTASVLSAWGMLTSDLRYELSRTHFESGSRSTADEVRRIFAELETRASERLRSWFDGPVTVERSAEMRYGEQIFEIDVALDGIDLDAPTLIKDIEARFHARHEELYTYASPDQEVVFVNARVAAIGAVSVPEAEVRAAAAAPACPPRAHREIFLGAWREVDVYALDDLKPGDRLIGPAIIEAETTTVLINERDELTINAFGWLDIRVAKAHSR